MSKELFDALVAQPAISTHDRLDSALNVDLVQTQKYAVAQGATNQVNVALLCANSHHVRSAFMTPDECNQFDRIVSSVKDKLQKASVNPVMQNKANSALWNHGRTF